MRLHLLTLTSLAALASFSSAAADPDVFETLERRIRSAEASVESCMASAAASAPKPSGCPFAASASAADLAAAHFRSKRAASHLKSQVAAKEVLEQVMRDLDDTDFDAILENADAAGDDDDDDSSPEKIVRSEVAKRIVACKAEGNSTFPSPHPICGHFDDQFSRVDGFCNNLKRPYLGAVGRPFRRLLHSRYEDGVDKPVGWSHRKYHGYRLPSPREVSTKIMISTDPLLTLSERFTAMNFQWGQFLDHDITLTPIVEDPRCATACNKTVGHGCFPIKVPKTEMRKCIPFSRSAGVCGKKTKREQINEITAYIDAGMVYGVSDDQLEMLRDKKDRRLLKVEGGTIKGGKPLPPKDDKLLCESSGGDGTVPCRVTGDGRANEIPTLLTMHTLFVREHNRIAVELSRLNPTLDPETIFQIARKIVIAQIQVITYKHWLPFVLKDPPKVSKGHSEYECGVDATLSNEFSTAAFRFAHGTIPFTLFLLKDDHGSLKGQERNLSTMFEATKLAVSGLDPMIRGLVSQSVKRPSPRDMMNSEIINKLFGTGDLAARNIQRGRDHGLQSYAAYLRKFGFIKGQLKTFQQLKHIITDADVLAKLKMVYKHPENIDLFVGGLAERRPPKSGATGPLFDRIIKDQFERLMNGDRFFFTHRGVFSSKQLEALHKVTLARVICDNNDGGIDRLPENVFDKVEPATFKCCADIPPLDLTAWRCGGSAPTLRPWPKHPTQKPMDFAAHWLLYRKGRKGIGKREMKKKRGSRIHHSDSKWLKEALMP